MLKWNLLIIAALLAAGFGMPPDSAAALSLPISSAPLWYNQAFEVRGDVVAFDLATASFTTAAGTTYTYTRSAPTIRTLADPTGEIQVAQHDVVGSGSATLTGTYRFSGTERIFDGQYGILTLQSGFAFTQVLFNVAMIPAEFEKLKAFNIEQMTSYSVAVDIPNDFAGRLPPPSDPGTGPSPIILPNEAELLIESLREPVSCCTDAEVAEILFMGRSLRNDDKSVNPRGNYLETAVAGFPRYAGRKESADEIQISGGFTTFIDVTSWSPKFQTGGGKFYAELQSSDPSAVSDPFFFYVASVRPGPGEKHAQWSVSVSPSVGISLGFAGVSLGVTINDHRGAKVGSTTHSIRLNTDFSVDGFPDRNDRGLGLRVGMGATDGEPGFYFMRFDAAMEYAYPTTYTYQQTGMSSRTFWRSAELSAGDKDPIWISLQADNWYPGSGQRFGEYSNFDINRNTLAKSRVGNPPCEVPPEQIVGTKVVARDPCADWNIVSATSFYYRWEDGNTPDLKGYLWIWSRDQKEYISLSGACGSIYDDDIGRYLLCSYYLPREGGVCPDGRVCLLEEGEYYEVLIADGAPIGRNSFVVQRHL